MKLYVHLIYLLGLLCFWEMVIQSENNLHEARAKKHEILNNLNIRQIDANNQALLVAIEKESANYPSPQATEYTSRAHNAFDCFGEARDQLQRLNDAEFWRFRTENYEFFRDVTDNDAYTAPEDLFISKKEQASVTGKIIDLGFPAVKNDFSIRLALAAGLSEYYCSKKISGTGTILDKFYPGLIAEDRFISIGKNISFGVVSSSWSYGHYDLKTFSKPLPPARDGILTLDTVFQHPGICKIPFQLYSWQSFRGPMTVQYDTISFNVFRH